MMRQTYCTVCVGGSNGRVNLFAGDGTPLGHDRFSVTNMYAVDREAALRCIDRLQQQHGGHCRAGLSLAGKLDGSRQGLSAAGTITGWVDRDLVADFSAALGSEVLLIEDAVSMALGELTYGNGAVPREDFFYVIWGTGIGGALVRFLPDGSPMGFPSQVGHMQVGNVGRRCGCGQSTCLEANASGRAITERYSLRGDKLPMGDWRDVCEFMAVGLSNITALTLVEHIIIDAGVGGNISKGRFTVLQRILAKRWTMSQVQLHRGTLGERSEILGTLARLQGKV